MKILYGVQGTGNGHISRARMMARYLIEQQDVDVTFLFSGRPREQYFDMDIFGDYLCRKGLTFQVKNGKLSYLQTIRQNNFLTFCKEVRALDLAPYDLVITDFEPVSAWAGRLSSKPAFGVGHQYAFAYDVPREGENPLSRFLMRNFAPASQSIGLHWGNFNGTILPPIVDPRLNEMRDQGTADDRKIVVYLPFENQQQVTALLRQIPDFQFYQYSADLADGQSGNVTLHKTSYEGFLRDLCSARAVICNAGFELVSESLQLGLDVLIKPLLGQPEQLSNAKALAELGLGTRVDQLDQEEIRNWLSKLPEPGTQRTTISYPDVARSLAHWIIDRQREDVRQLVERVWSECVPLDSHEESWHRAISR